MISVNNGIRINIKKRIEDLKKDVEDNEIMKENYLNKVYDCIYALSSENENLKDSLPFLIGVETANLVFYLNGLVDIPFEPFTMGVVVISALVPNMYNLVKQKLYLKIVDDCDSCINNTLSELNDCYKQLKDLERFEKVVKNTKTINMDQILDKSGFAREVAMKNVLNIKM